MNAYAKSVDKDRKAWRAEMPPRCMWCGTEERHVEWPGLETHEMLPRGRTHNAWGFRENYLLVCHNPCHKDAAGAGLAAQLACKRRCDPGHYDREKVLRIRNPRAMEYVTEQEVDNVGEPFAEMRRVLIGGGE